MPQRKRRRSSGCPSVLSSEEIEQPPRTDHACPQGLCPLPQLAIRCDQRDLFTGGTQDGIDERVVAAPASMENRHTVVRARLDTLPSLAFENDDDRLLEPPRINGCVNVVHERPSRSGSVPPPAGRAGPHHIGRIDEKHCSSLIDPVRRRGPKRR